MFETIAIVAATALGPLAAVLITLWHQDRREKRTTKINMFMRLMAERKKVPSLHAAEALNCIDVAFSDNADVKRLWHKYYVLLCVPITEQIQERQHTWLELLHAMAQDLHYPKLTQTDLDKFYLPQGHQDNYETTQAVMKHLLRVLENADGLSIAPKKMEKELVLLNTPKNESDA